MESVWLEDFLAVLKYGGFSRAAEVRHITQSALSRRIRSLENWVGTPLFYRTTRSVSLSPAGDSFRVTAEETLRRLASGRSEALELAHEATGQLRFASTNALSLVFFPVWLRRVEASLPFRINIQLVANHMEACEQLMIQGQAQFLLCHCHPKATTVLTPGQFLSLQVGDDILMPVSVPKAEGGIEPMFALPGNARSPLPYLSYRPESGMGRIVAAFRRASMQKAWLRPTFTSHLAKLLVTMTLEKRGAAWLPKSLISEYLEAGTLVSAGDRSWEIPIEIHVFRPCARQSSVAERFWSNISPLTCSQLEPLA
jgi:DNA-binding transcriptional LysR family regulator